MCTNAHIHYHSHAGKKPILIALSIWCRRLTISDTKTHNCGHCVLPHTIWPVLKVYQCTHHYHSHEPILIVRGHSIHSVQKTNTKTRNCSHCVLPHTIWPVLKVYQCTHIYITIHIRKKPILIVCGHSIHSVQKTNNIRHKDTQMPCTCNCQPSRIPRDCPAYLCIVPLSHRGALLSCTAALAQM